MINAITEAVSAALNAEYGDHYTIIREANKQDLEEPCFFISCISPGRRQFLGRRYFRKNKFCIQYFPESENTNEECHAVAERLFSCLEYVSVSGNLLRGTAMQYEIADGVLDFFVNYDFFTLKGRENMPMDKMETRNDVKE